VGSTATPANATGPQDIAADDGGDLWYLSELDRIVGPGVNAAVHDGAGRITDGPGEDGAPQAVASDTVDRLWFAESGAAVARAGGATNVHLYPLRRMRPGRYTLLVVVDDRVRVKVSIRVA
jgi:streptogramin lyase